jgi:uracil-DNA glycosylase
MAEEKDKQLEKVKEEIVSCKKCFLYRTRKYPVIGKGSHSAKILFCGEAPGYWEDQRGEPFVGKAGAILDELLHSIGLERKNVYITNLLKCRPPENRDPNFSEIKACTPYLEKQIEVIKPKVISPLGRFSMSFLMEKFGLKEKIEPIGKIHGTLFKVNSLFQRVTLVPLYHPAVATYNPNMIEILKKDFQTLKTIIN